MADRDQLETEARGGPTDGADRDALSETLDDDHLTGEYPPEHPLGSTDYGVTPAEGRVQEPIDERVRREKPETSTVGSSDRAGRLVEPDEGTHTDTEAEAVASVVDQVAPHDRPVGDVGTGDVTSQETATELTQDLSAEEAAMRVQDERDAP